MVKWNFEKLLGKNVNVGDISTLKWMSIEDCFQNILDARKKYSNEEDQYHKSFIKVFSDIKKLYRN